MLKIAQQNTQFGEMIIFNCPRCNAVNRVNVLSFCIADDWDFALRCPDCDEEFYFEITCLTRSAQLRDEADRAGAGESPKDLRTEDNVDCPRCAGTGKVTINSGRRYPCGKCNGSGQIARDVRR